MKPKVKVKCPYCGTGWHYTGNSKVLKCEDVCNREFVLGDIIEVVHATHKIEEANTKNKPRMVGTAADSLFQRD